MAIRIQSQVRIGPPLYDTDALVFITATGITNNTQKNAINQLVLDLKAYSIWTKFSALYPMVGGTATTHKFNLKNPLDTDGAFRLVFNGGWTHSANGALPNGTNAYADTKLIPSSVLSLNSTHLSYYSRTTGAIGYPYGANDVGNTNRTLWEMAGGTNYIAIYTAPSLYFDYSSATSLSMLTANRTASNLSNAWAANIKKATSTNASLALTTKAIFIGANNGNGTAGIFCNAQCAFASIGAGLTDTEVPNFYTAVQAFQTTLGRQV